jgi:hypothetical protein
MYCIKIKILVLACLCRIRQLAEQAGNDTISSLSSIVSQQVSLLQLGFEQVVVFYIVH